jgi:hypothetical protein
VIAPILGRYVFDGSGLSYSWRTRLVSVVFWPSVRVGKVGEALSGAVAEAEPSGSKYGAGNRWSHACQADCQDDGGEAEDRRGGA